MRAVLTIDVPDEFLREHIEELWTDPAFAGDETPKPEPQDFLRQRLEELAGDELRVALFGWPIETTVEVHGWFPVERERIYDLFRLTPADRELADRMSDEWLKSRSEAAESREHFLEWLRNRAQQTSAELAKDLGLPEGTTVRYDDRPVLGCCPHGVDLDRAMCEHGCRV